LPVIGLRERWLLVAEKPTMSIRGMKDVNVPPLERTRWGNQWDREMTPSGVVSGILFACRNQSKSMAKRKKNGRLDAEKHVRRRGAL
jgi:hypothetical protein